MCMYGVMSACEQCCRLCNNSIPFKVYNELRGATYITVFDGICQFLTTLWKILRAETRLTNCDRPKIACDCWWPCDCANFCRIQSNTEPHPYHNTSSVYVVTIPAAAINMVFAVGGILFCWISSSRAYKMELFLFWHDVWPLLTWKRHPWTVTGHQRYKCLWLIWCKVRVWSSISMPHKSHWGHGQRRRFC